MNVQLFPYTGERFFQMTLASIPRPSDHSYGMNAYYAVEKAHYWLFPNQQEFQDGSPEYLFKILEDMRRQQPFEPDYPPEETPTEEVDGLRHRTPVWAAIDAVLQAESGANKFETQQERAAWFQEQLRLTVRHKNFRACVRSFQKELTKIGLTMSEGGCSGMVMLVVNEEHTGGEAIVIVKNVVKNLLPAVKARI